jgi:hypothetical protein
VIRPTRSSMLLSNLNNNNINNNRSTDENVRMPSSPKICEVENSEKKVRRRWKSVVNSLCESRTDLWWTTTTTKTSQHEEFNSNVG